MSTASKGEAYLRRLSAVLKTQDSRKLAEWVSGYVHLYNDLMGSVDAMPNAVANALERAGFKEASFYLQHAPVHRDVAGVAGHAVEYIIYIVRAVDGPHRMSELVAKDCELAQMLPC